jgi:RNA polymerase sigma factor (sigma-70 family)
MEGMAYVAPASLARQLGSLFDGGCAAGLSDRELLERFTARSDPIDEAAFAAIVARHGPMVLGICRQLLGDVHHAEDAFQAVFLVLARQARSIRDPDRLGAWLYGVALRTARKARGRIARRRQTEEAGANSRPEARPAVQAESLIEREQAEALHDEIDRLPGAFRLPIVLCYFEGLSPDEAARRLRWPSGTLRCRLVRVRDRLRRGLIRRGIVLSGTGLAAALAPLSASASVSSLLCDSTTRAAISFAARRTAGGALSAPAAAMAREVLHTMLIHKLRSVFMTVLVLATLATGAGWLTRSLATAREGPRGAAVSEPQVVAKPEESPRPAPGRMFVVGRILDPQGKPMAGVAIDVVGRPRKTRVATGVSPESRVLIGRGETGADGRFRFDAARTASTRFFEVDAVAAAPGFGLGWARLNPDAEQPGAEITLRPEQAIRARAVDINGQPAAGVQIWVGRVGRYTKTGTFEGVNMGEPPAPEGLRAGPRPVKTDQEGRFTLAGFDRGPYAGLVVDDPRFAHQWLDIQTDDPKGPRELALVLQPATIMEGRIIAADTGRPIPDAAISVAASRDRFGDMYITHFRADDEGRYTANPSPGRYFRVSAYPPEGQPYLIPESEFAWTKGTVKRTLDFRLTRGVLIRGRVTDEKTGLPLAGASVQYLGARTPDGVIDGSQAVAASKDDGSFQIAVLPGKGHLFVYGPTADYVLESIGSQMIYRGQPGGQRYYAHKIIPYEFKAGDRPESLAAALRPGKTVKGHIVDPQGQAVDKAEIISLLHFNYFHLNWRGDLTVHARDGRFELHGLDEEKATPAYFLDAEHEWGATVELSGKQAGEDVTIRLRPCGRAKARFVGPDGKPVARISALLEILGSPGPDPFTRDPKERTMLAADVTYIANVDRKHYWHGPLTNSEGRVILPDLIPGATYRIKDRSDPNKGPRVRKDFTVKPGETLDLGEILIEKPAS